MATVGAWRHGVGTPQLGTRSSLGCNHRSSICPRYWPDIEKNHNKVACGKRFLSMVPSDSDERKERGEAHQRDRPNQSWAAGRSGDDSRFGRGVPTLAAQGSSRSVPIVSPSRSRSTWRRRARAVGTIFSAAILSLVRSLISGRKRPLHPTDP